MMLLLTHSVTHDGSEYKPGVHDTTNWPQSQVDQFLKYKWSVRPFNAGNYFTTGTTVAAPDKAQGSFLKDFEAAEQARNNKNDVGMPVQASPATLAPGPALDAAQTVKPVVKVDPIFAIPGFENTLEPYASPEYKDLDGMVGSRKPPKGLATER